MTSAYASLIYSDDYACGAYCLGRRLNQLDPCRPRVLLVGPNVSKETCVWLSKEWHDQRRVDELAVNADDGENQAGKMLGRPELAGACAKASLWSLTEFEFVVYLDADTLPVKPLNDLFGVLAPQHPNLLSAAPDVGWPDIFNSGVLVLKPSHAITENLRLAAREGTSFDGSDQGLLNEYFAKAWKRLPFIYNVTASGSYQYIPAFMRFVDEIKIYHFIGAVKPWHQPEWQTFPTNKMHAAWNEAYNEALANDRGPRPHVHFVKDPSPVPLPAPIPSPQRSPEPSPPPVSPPLEPEQKEEDIEETCAKIDELWQETLHPNANRLIHAPPNWWDATQFAPPRRLGAEAPGVDVFSARPEPQAFEFPESPAKKISKDVIPWSINLPVATRVWPDSI